MKIFCEECDGLGYNEIPDYDWDGNLLDEGISYQCSECKGRGFSEVDNGSISDGSHTFNELYHHRCILFSIICNQNKDKAWKSKLHDDGTMFENYFIVGINCPGEGQFSYHYNLRFWDLFSRVEELEFAPKWDGHEPEDVVRLLSLFRGSSMSGKNIEHVNFDDAPESWSDRCSGDGHERYVDENGERRFRDNDVSLGIGYRPCAKCGEYPTEEGHDACFGKEGLGNVMNACCGHGKNEGYIQFDNGIRISGKFTIERWD